jgi:Flp pilus assembly pilin Flp
MDFCKKVLWHALVDEEATTIAEYGLLLMLIALLVVSSALVVGEGTSTLFQRTGEIFEGASVPTTP